MRARTVPGGKASGPGQLHVREDVLQEVVGEPYALLVRRLEALVWTVPRILYDLGRTRARVLAKHHDLGLGLGLGLLETLEIAEVVAVHSKDVVESVKVFEMYLLREGLRSATKTHRTHAV